jgi:osmoprotectant transport system permease protein
MDFFLQVIRWLTDPSHWDGPDGIPIRLAEHIGISAASIVIATAVAFPVGLWIGHTRRGVGFAINLANLGRAIPSLAAIGIVVPFTQAIDPDAGFSIYPTLVAMVVLAIPPILVNTFTGVAQVDRDLVESARGMGFREREILARVEVPVAVPVIVGGVRSAAVQVIATATLGAIYGLGGLGRYVVDGIAQNDDAKLFSGVILVAVLALASEGGLALIQWQATSPGLKRRSSSGAPAAS